MTELPFGTLLADWDRIELSNGAVVRRTADTSLARQRAKERTRRGVFYPSAFSEGSGAAYFWKAEPTHVLEWPQDIEDPATRAEPFLLMEVLRIEFLWRQGRRNEAFALAHTGRRFLGRTGVLLMAPNDVLLLAEYVASLGYDAQASRIAEAVVSSGPLREGRSFLDAGGAGPILARS